MHDSAAGRNRRRFLPARPLWLDAATVARSLEAARQEAGRAGRREEAEISRFTLRCRSDTSHAEPSDA